MQALWQELTDLVLPGGCAGCGVARASRRLCTRCRALLGRAVPRPVRPSPAPVGLPSVHAALPYADEARAVLLAHKERGALPLAEPLGRALAGAVRAAVAGSGACRPVLLVPVPSARRSVAARGHDPVRRVASAAAAALRRAGEPARVVPVLRQRRKVADQAGLTAARRAANLSGALETAPGAARLLSPRARCRPGAVQPLVVLVDDLITTGASLAEASRVVTERTGVLPAGAVVAAGGRNHPSRPVVAGGTGDIRPIGGTCQ
ncbi:ComF family protein [Streptomyces sp. DSM 42041]|uniref:ComF family protein n=1 Tax=Streptomyces hazeniae TaxID=3075538 RepID=A0ABU2NXF4_9ACTN|nr:ComF family protein [Streptomyces sp. DSM 42041]MDT0381658.1 ComF family protein [Streptomyces sp. DSM 42041]